jgi:hypothetical protein
MACPDAVFGAKQTGGERHVMSCVTFWDNVVLGVRCSKNSIMKPLALLETLFRNVG